MRVVLRTFLQILNASTCRRTLISLAIIALAVIVVLVAVSFRNDLTEDELLGALPILPPAGPTEVQPVRPLAASTAAPPAGDVETGMQTSTAFRELVPSPRPRPVDKRRLRQARNVREIPDNVLPILFAGAIEIQPVRPPAALITAPPVGDAETLVQDPITSSEEPGRLLPLAGAIEIQAVRLPSTAAPAGGPETGMQSSGASRELVPSPPSRRTHKSRPRRAHDMGKRSNSSVATLPAAGPNEIQPVRPPAASTAAPPAGGPEPAMQSSGASRELVPSPPSRRAHKSRPRRAQKMGKRSNSSVATLPAAGPNEVQAVRPQSASTAAPPVGGPETSVQSSGASRELVPSPPSRRAHKPRRAHDMGKRSNSSVATLPPAGPTEVQPVRPLAASTAAPPGGDAETAMQSSEASRELVPSPRPRPVQRSRQRQEHNIRNVPNNVRLRDAVVLLKDLRDQSQIEKVIQDNPSNIFLLLLAEIRRASQESDRLIENLIDEIEPPTLVRERNYAKASRAQLEAYRLDLEAAEANAMAAISRYVALLEREREKVEAVVRSLNLDDRYIRAALSGIDKRQAQSTDITSKMLSANAEFYRASGRYVAFLIEHFGYYKVSANGHFMFSSESIADRYEVVSRQINEAIKRIAELEEERKKLNQFKQEEWERFAWGD
jgi:hypothetical protein